MTLYPIFHRFAIGAAFFVGATSFAQAQADSPLIDALVRKGILSTEEAIELRAELNREAKASKQVLSVPGSKNVSKLAISGRVQAQYNLVDNDADNASAAVTNSRFSLRRVRLGATADLGKDFRGVLSYDMASNNLDVGYIRWNQSSELSVDVGFRKVNFGYEENTSSSRLPAIERSPVTRFFVEENNGRRLGAGARRTGVFADGKVGNAFYGAAATNVERTANPGTGQVGDSNQVALWVNGGLKGKSENTSYTTGVSLGYLPEQVRSASTSAVGVITPPAVIPGALLVASVYGDVTIGNMGLTGELLWSDNDAGAGANSWGFHVIPTYNLSEKLQLVARLAYLDTDGIGTRPSDVVPGAGNAAVGLFTPGFETVTEIYGGMNYLFMGNDVKFSAGLFYANFEDQIGGAGNVEAQSIGLRSQMQVNF